MSSKDETREPEQAKPSLRLVHSVPVPQLRSPRDRLTQDTTPASAPNFEPIEGFGGAGGAEEEQFDPRRTMDHARMVSMLAPADVIGEIVIEGLHARGGICEIYVGRHSVLGERVAVKVISAPYAGRLDVAHRLELEAAALYTLRGEPGIVRIVTAGRDPRVGPYIVMELLEGQSLRELLSKAGNLGVRRAVQFTIELADIMHALHVYGLIHRDMKPENVFLKKDKGGRYALVVLDFGCVKSPNGAKTTDQAQAMGTVRYMSPEHVDRQHPISVKSDIYALGHILYEMLLGEHAHDRDAREAAGGGNPFIEMSWHVTATIAPLPEILCPPDLWTIITHMIARDPAQRFDTMEAAGNALSNFLRSYEQTAAAEPPAQVVASAARAASAAPRLQINIPGAPRAESPEPSLPASVPPPAPVLAPAPALAPAAAPAPAATAPPAVRRGTLPALTAPRAVVGSNPRVDLHATITVPTLLIAKGDDKHRHILNDGAVIGRESDASICIDDVGVSRRHAELRRRPDTDELLYDVADLGSTNGLVVAGAKTRAVTLTAFDTLQIGDSVLQILPPGTLRPDGTHVGLKPRRTSAGTQPLDRDASHRSLARPRLSRLAAVIFLGLLATASVLLTLRILADKAPAQGPEPSWTAQPNPKAAP